MVLSVIITMGAEAILVFPAASVATAVIECDWLSLRSTSIDQLPPLTVADPVKLPSTLLVKVIEEPFSPFPVIVSPVVACVILSVFDDPVSSEASRSRLEGIAGAVLSTVSQPGQIVETFPAGSMATIS